MFINNCANVAVEDLFVQICFRVSVNVLLCSRSSTAIVQMFLRRSLIDVSDFDHVTKLAVAVIG